MFASAMMFGAMAFAAKIAAARLSGPEVALVRMAFGLLPVLLVPRWLRSAIHVQRFDLILFRGIFGGIAVMLYFFSLQHTSVGVATLLNYTSPIWSGLLSTLFLHERFSARVLVPLPIAFIGIFLVVHAHAQPGEVLGFGRWELAGALSAVAGGAAITSIRAARRTESSWAVYASFCFFGMLVNAPLALLGWQWPRRDEWIALAATGLLAMGAQLYMTFSLRWLDAMTTGVISQLAVVMSFLFGAVFLHDRITPAAALGSALTIGGVIGVIYLTSRYKRLAEPEVVT
jgi:drug/metabolite transporter (DMT)-like permease